MKRIIILGGGSISKEDFIRILSDQILDCVYVDEKAKLFNEMKDQLKEVSLNRYKMDELENKSHSQFKNYKEVFNSKHLHRQFR